MAFLSFLHINGRVGLGLVLNWYISAFSNVWALSEGRWQLFSSIFFLLFLSIKLMIYLILSYLNFVFYLCFLYFFFLLLVYLQACEYTFPPSICWWMKFAIFTLSVDTPYKYLIKKKKKVILKCFYVPEE